MDTIRENIDRAGRSESMHSRASSIRPGTAVGTVEEELELGGTLDRVSSFDHRTTRGSKHSSGEGANTIVNRVKVKHGQTTVISISGAAGCGKSSLVQSVASTARAHGYFTSAKFDQVKKTPFEPLIKVLSSRLSSGKYSVRRMSAHLFTTTYEIWYSPSGQYYIPTWISRNGY